MGRNACALTGASMNYLRTAILLAGLTALFMAVGFLIGGESGALLALIVAGAMNLISYWNADKLVLAMHGAAVILGERRGKHPARSKVASEAASASSPPKA